MNATLKKKLCWNCEARVDLESQNCPFCAVYLGPAPTDKGKRTDDILAPPYKLVEAPAVPFSVEEKEEATEKEYEVESPGYVNEFKKVALPLAFLSGGLLFLLFSLILALFSNEGVFTLKWNGDYWYYYLACALPMLIIGWKTLTPEESV